MSLRTARPPAGRTVTSRCRSCQVISRDRRSVCRVPRKSKGGRRCQPCTGGRSTRPRTRRPSLRRVSQRVHYHQRETTEPLHGRLHLHNVKIARCGTRSTSTQTDSWMRRSTRCDRTLSRTADGMHACAHLERFHHTTHNMTAGINAPVPISSHIHFAPVQGYQYCNMSVSQIESHYTSISHVP